MGVQYIYRATDPMMRAAALLLVLLLGGSTRGMAQTSSCPRVDATSTRFVQLVTRMATGTNQLAQRQRTLLKIPQVSASQISYVTDSRSCGKAVTPYNANTEQANSSGLPIRPSGRPYVVKAGTVYVTMDPAKSNGHYMTLVTLDKNFKFLASGLK
jgi:hypothetical protein